jgi:hypothetical protein
MAFIIGMYEADMSGDKDKMRIRASEAGSLDSVETAALSGSRTLFRSAEKAH